MFESRNAKEISLLPQTFRQGSGAQSTGQRGSFPAVKLPMCEAENSPLFSAEVKSKWSYTSTPRTRLQGMLQDPTNGLDHEADKSISYRRSTNPVRYNKSW